MDTTNAIDGLVAWKGRLSLKDATWSIKSGRAVEFELIQEPGAPLVLHPFAGFVKRRGNRVGSRFHLSAVCPGSEQPAYDGQVMLMAGGSPLGRPMTVKFWLPEHPAEHPFDGYSPDQEFAAVFVELAPDETAIDQTQRNLLENASDRRDHSLSQFAAMLCDSPLFHSYLAEKVLLPLDQPEGAPTMCSMEPSWWAGKDRAAKWLRKKCEIDSRAALDTDDEASARFHYGVRRPYQAWCQEHGYDAGPG